MMIALGLIGAGIYFAFSTLESIFLSNPYLNGLILTVFVIGVVSCFGQVVQLVRSVGWIKKFARDLDVQGAPVLLAPLATLLRSRGARMQISSTSARSILDSVASRIDEDREITKYLGNTLIFLGLLGTFYGLATTVPALVDTIRSLNADEGASGADVFAKLQVGLESQLGGMGTAFSSSLLGLAGSLIVGLLELFAGHGQNRFYRELEEWLSSITRLGFAAGDEGGMEFVGGGSNDQLVALIRASEEGRLRTDEQIAQLSATVSQLAARMDDQDIRPALAQAAAAQQEMAQKLAESGVDGIDAESRMRLRSIDVQLLRILEELSAGRQETITELRGELGNISRALRQMKRNPGQE
ncbi:biopolymer transporter ExbB [Marivivens niveibacter]|uniref:Biopolymer transporter ExbB n=1 Tax=Marivivens niveibacter TaxID=1930667 RepID=A0A251WYZ4_9RHOB|nr:biopolymer transporter ExbB [Marivivens niveibacter]OUD09355.1 biopolymer transporter ExbB [Marivivens niveibacter]